MILPFARPRESLLLAIDQTLEDSDESVVFVGVTCPLFLVHS